MKMKMDLIFFNNGKLEFLVEKEEIMPVAVFFKTILQAFYAGVEAAVGDDGKLSRQYEFGRFIAENYLKNDNKEFDDFIALTESLEKEIDTIIIS